MTPSRRVKCDYPGCDKGLIPHVKRMLDEKTPDPFDHQTQEICPKCEGCGSVPYVYPGNIPETKPTSIYVNVPDTWSPQQVGAFQKYMDDCLENRGCVKLRRIQGIETL